MNISRNDNFGYLYNGGKVTGTLSVSGGTPSLTNLPDQNSASGEVTVADNGVGDFTITITNFRGTEAKSVAFATTTTADMTVRVVSKTYTNDSLAVNFIVRTADQTSAVDDSGFEFCIEAY